VDDVTFSHNGANTDTGHRDSPGGVERRSLSSSVALLWLPCVADKNIIFPSCGFFFFFLSSFFSFSSSPNLSRRRLDVYHTSTHSVALVRIKDAGLKRAARGSLKYRTQKIAKNSPSGHHRTTLSGYIFATKICNYRQSEKKLVKQQYLLHMSVQYGKLRPTSG